MKQSLTQGLAMNMADSLAYLDGLSELLSRTRGFERQSRMLARYLAAWREVDTYAFIPDL